MSWAHLHLMINHLPVLGAPLVLLLLGWALVRRSPGVARIALWGTVLLGPVAQFVSVTGERSEDRLEHVVALDEALVERHEETAELGTRLLLLTAAFAAFALWRTRRAPNRRLLPATVFTGLLVASATLAYAAWTGGMIRHTEIHSRNWPTAAAEEHAERD